MFIEVYTIPIHDWNLPTEKLKVPKNRRLISVDGINVKYSTACSIAGSIKVSQDQAFMSPITLFISHLIFSLYVMFHLD